jgi:integrase
MRTKSADFVEFLGLAGLGQAEAAALTWGDVDWKRKRMNIRRRKTDVCFTVPIYPDLRPLLERRRKEANDTSRDCRVFAVKGPQEVAAGSVQPSRLPCLRAAQSFAAIALDSSGRLGLILS